MRLAEVVRQAGGSMEAMGFHRRSAAHTIGGEGAVMWFSRESPLVVVASSEDCPDPITVLAPPRRSHLPPVSAHSSHPWVSWCSAKRLAHIVRRFQSFYEYSPWDDLKQGFRARNITYAALDWLKCLPGNLTLSCRKFEPGDAVKHVSGNLGLVLGEDGQDVTVAFASCVQKVNRANLDPVWCLTRLTPSEKMARDSGYNLPRNQITTEWTVINSSC